MIVLRVIDICISDNELEQQQQKQSIRPQMRKTIMVYVHRQSPSLVRVLPKLWLILQCVYFHRVWILNQLIVLPLSGLVVLLQLSLLTLLHVLLSSLLLRLLKALVLNNHCHQVLKLLLLLDHFLLRSLLLTTVIYPHMLTNHNCFLYIMYFQWSTPHADGSEIICVVLDSGLHRIYTATQICITEDYACKWRFRSIRYQL